MRAVLAGVGMVARTHVEAIAATQGAITLHGLCARRPERAAAFARDFVASLAPQPRVYADIAEVAADPEVDFVIIATPPDARGEAVRLLAAAGKPILMEKPIERTVAAATAIVETCEAARVPLGIVFQHRMRESAISLR